MYYQYTSTTTRVIITSTRVPLQYTSTSTHVPLVVPPPRLTHRASWFERWILWNFVSTNYWAEMVTKTEKIHQKIMTRLNQLRRFEIVLSKWSGGKEFIVLLCYCANFFWYVLSWILKIVGYFVKWLLWRGFGPFWGVPCFSIYRHRKDSVCSNNFF